MTHPYATEAYARALPHVGCAVQVPEWDAWVIMRPLPDGLSDAAGPYPLAIVPRDADIPAGLARLRGLGLVSLALVMDEAHRPDTRLLAQHFAVVRPFKTHLLRRPAEPFAYGAYHGYKVRRARRRVQARRFELRDHLADWAALYAVLARRKALAGVHDFPMAHFEALGSLPGVEAVGAWMEGVLVSAHIWVRAGDQVHSHLGATSEAGYAAGAAYAVYDESIRHFADAAVINLGGSAGAAGDATDGLARFKRGFANAEAPAWICGAVLDPLRYAALCRDRGVDPAATAFFPAYRA
jgi:hypothetical protein